MTKEKPPKQQRSIEVIVRCRPLSAIERGRGDLNIIQVNDDCKTVILKDPNDHTDDGSADDITTARSKETTFRYDHAFDEGANQRALYEATAMRLVDEVVSGRSHCTVFAYGSTGSGKTHTMSGPPNQDGVIQMALKDLFARLPSSPSNNNNNNNNNNNHEDDTKVTAMYTEIYNEQIRDLTNPERAQSLTIRENRDGIVLPDVQTFPCSSVEDALQLLALGAANRTTDSHNMNEASSRSHAIFQVSVHRSHTSTATTTTTTKLTLIDLAGSEGVRKTGVRSEKMRKEGANINKSLLALANVINALSQSKAGLYIPYRDSKLTRMLKDALTGRSRTIMIANISPSSTQRTETRETMAYAQRCMSITAKPERKTVNRMDINYYRTTVTQLQAQLAELQRLARLPNNDDVSANNTTGARGKHRNSMVEIVKTEEIREKIIQNTDRLIASKHTYAEVMETQTTNHEALEALETLVDQWYTTNCASLPVINTRASAILGVPPLLRVESAGASAAECPASVLKVISMLNDAAMCVEVPFDVKNAIDERTAVLASFEQNRVFMQQLEDQIQTLLSERRSLVAQIALFTDDTMRPERRQLLQCEVERGDYELHAADLELQLVVYQRLLDSEQMQAEVLRVVREEAERKLQQTSQAHNEDDDNDDDDDGDDVAGRRRHYQTTLPRPPLPATTEQLQHDGDGVESRLVSSRSARLLHKTRARLNARLKMTSRVVTPLGLRNRHRRSNTEEVLDLPFFDSLQPAQVQQFRKQLEIQQQHQAPPPQSASSPLLQSVNDHKEEEEPVSPTLSSASSSSSLSSSSSSSSSSPPPPAAAAATATQQHQQHQLQLQQEQVYAYGLLAVLPVLLLMGIPAAVILMMLVWSVFQLRTVYEPLLDRLIDSIVKARAAAIRTHQH